MSGLRRGVIVVVEVDNGIVMVHPNHPESAEASLPGYLVSDGEAAEEGAVWVVAEYTGLEVEIVGLITEFDIAGTPFGELHVSVFLAHAVGGTLSEDGPDGPARVHGLHQLPAIMPIRVANQRALAAYLKHRDEPT